ncbi:MULTISPECIES: poly-beta-1,6 N-acetyl-D-glucosamine export porin PgaA [unclassified Acinetobacter]|uniref:poly-beta-1,6 N-acetyl-D-glucosamine export porin PgaA n=1 Tax=unclassified Acinetobacter TaxID=196816 RepID=UPI001909D17F|nr:MULTISPECIES: poly-beta-1,6 N-acetyl-D-glucosamine export porin PgaA [unclassified Acinetobacter]MBK0064054.1 poly-beta-1,6 N-acetyl-D-glucosamine export porin PgaA [Acinetobacter sp. S55]MBK0067437.1 poly-beta-1,6 N-acetyl-D-glucosamine export porin PgaA [Acinetobacter sp. S54]
MRKKINLRYIGILSLCSVSVGYAATSEDQQREAIIAEIKQGQINTGIAQLENLRARYPADQKLLADYIIVLYQNNRFGLKQLTLLNNLNRQSYPQYGELVVVKALRDLKQLDLAERYASLFNHYHPSSDMQLLLGIVQTESKKKLQAIQTFKTIQLTGLSPEQLAQLSYAYRVLDMPVEALNAANLAMTTTQPDEPIQEQYIYALIMNSDFRTAEQYIQQHQLEQKIPNIGYTVKTREFSQKIKNAIQYYKVKNYQGEATESYLILDQVLVQMQAFEPELPTDPVLRHLFYYDYIYALSFRNRYSDAIQTLVKLNQPYEQMPPYVRQALADAFLKNRQPKQAEYLYKSVLKEKNYADYSVYSGLYYALIEQEKFDEANKLVQEMDQLLPTFRYSAAKGVDKTTHEDRAEYLALVGLNYAYRNEHAKAERYFQDLVTKAPNNIGYQNNLATVQRWREKPQISSETLDQFNGIEPVSISTLVNQMQNNQALGRVVEWREQNKLLNVIAADDSGVQQSKKELEDRNHISIQHESIFSKSHADQPEVLQNLTGSSEREHQTRINTPWFANDYRAYIALAQRKAEFKGENLTDERYGIGLEWANNRRSVNLQLSQRSHSNDVGIQVDWSQWLNDHWQFALGFNSQATIPLQALKQGYEGKAFKGQLSWQANESRKAGLAYQFTDIEDDNHRHEIVGYFTQQIYQAPHHITRLTLRNEYDKNSNIQVSYFNPRYSNSAEIILSHDWMTWRNYERHFSQHFEVGTGAFSQANYSTKALFNILYRHDWQLSRTWSVNYGIGWSNHPYDEENERKTYAQFGFEGRF